METFTLDLIVNYLNYPNKLTHKEYRHSKRDNNGWPIWEFKIHGVWLPANIAREIAHNNYKSILETGSIQ